MSWHQSLYDLATGRRFDRIDAKLNVLIQQGQRLMPAIDDLKAALTDLTSALTDNTAEIETLLSKIATPGTSDADIAVAVTQIRTLIADNKAEVDKAKAAAP